MAYVKRLRLLLDQRSASPTNILHLFTILSVICSATHQLFFNIVPRSLMGVVPAWYDRSFLVCELMGSLLVLFGLFSKRLVAGLALERAGYLLLVTTSLALWVALCNQYQTFPNGLGAWMVLFFATWSVVRIGQITRVFMALSKVDRESNGTIT